MLDAKKLLSLPIYEVVGAIIYFQVLWVAISI